MTNYLGKGERSALKRLHVIDQDGQISLTMTTKEEIEQAIMQYNQQHYTKANDTNIYKDKIYEQLQYDSVRNSIIDGTLERDDCHNDETYEFL